MMMNLLKGIYLLGMATTENLGSVCNHHHFGIYLLGMTTIENVKADGFDYVDGIDLLEMTAIGNQLFRQ